MRLIDADMVIKSIVAEKNAVEKTKRDGTMDEYEVGVHCDLTLAHAMVLNAPTIDALEVVRCFDCEYGFDWDRDEPYDEVYCAGYCNLREADEVIVQVYSCDYCSYGKRRNDG